jgi:nucleotide-binding universal stress UspA family protein
LPRLIAKLVVRMKSILVPIDFSDATARVLDQAKEAAKAFGAEIHLVYVKELMPASPPSTFGYGVAGTPELLPMPNSPVPTITPVSPELDERQKSKLVNWQKEIQQSGLKVVLHEPTGNVVEEILEEANALKPDLIVMGRHGHGAMYNLLVGSVTEGVLKRTGCPVLLVPSARS